MHLYANCVFIAIILVQLVVDPAGGGGGGGGGIQFDEPESELAEMEWEENIPPETSIMNVNVSGGDVIFSMSNEYLEIDRDTGLITVKADAVIDYEALLPNTTFNATFTVTEIPEKDSDKDPGVLHGVLTMIIIDVNEPPTFDADKSVIHGFSILNNSIERTYIGRVEALDYDTQAEDYYVNAYQIRTPDTPFAISNAGTIRLQLGKNVDMNVTRVWTVVIEAVDAGRPRQTGSTTIYIGVCGSCRTGTGNVVCYSVVSMVVCLLASIWMSVKDIDYVLQ